MGAIPQSMVGIFGLKPRSEFGRCLATATLESSAVSVSLSPTARHLIVGLTVRSARIAMALGDRTMMAQIYRIVMPPEDQQQQGSGPGQTNSLPEGPRLPEYPEHAVQNSRLRGRLDLRRNIHMTQQTQSLNCVKWIPVPGLGIVYATNTGLLKILR